MQTKKTNEAKVVYAVLLAVIAALSVLVIVTGIMARRSKEGVDTSNLNDTSVFDAFGRTTSDDTTKANDETSGKTSDTEAMNREVETTEQITEGAAATETDDLSVSAQTTLPEFIAPVSGVVSKEHSESVLVFSLTMNDYRTHTGVDISASDGESVAAAADGVVLSVWSDPMWGYCISISHEGDAVTVYKNLTEESIRYLEAGDIVYKGEVIGAVGDSALYEIADEPHLHFEFSIGGVNVDPCEYIEFAGSDVTEDE
ncbi:MAG: M23 family metallopeptidase [Firmicutes bacterium]|nr:M23 family metallopeptidase [Bacillota bacterium]